MSTILRMFVHAPPLDFPRVKRLQTPHHLRCGDCCKFNRRLATVEGIDDGETPRCPKCLQVFLDGVIAALRGLAG